MGEDRRLLTEDEEIAEDLDRLFERSNANLPAREPGVPSLYEEVWPKWLVGYSTKPVATRVVPLSRKKYPTPELARARFAELQQRHGWRVVEQFNTARHWCWRIC